MSFFKKSAPKKIDLKINLVPKDPFFETVLGRSFRWALGVGRYIVIFTELVVIISFGSRFVLDRQLTDLNAKINQQKQVIKSYGDLEKNFRYIQQQITDYQQLKQENNLVEIFPILNETVPQNVVLDSLTIKNGSIDFTGVAFSQSTLNILVNNLQLSEHFTNIRISKLESSNNKSSGINFDIASEIKW